MQKLLVFMTVFVFGIANGFAQNLLLKNARILDPSIQEITQASILIQEDQIVEILDSSPKEFEGEIVDLLGKWIIPGLNDMHVHSYGNMGPGRKVQYLSTAGTAKMMLFCGVTGFLDLFNAEDYILNLREKQRKAGLAGADIYCAGPCFTCTGGHCSEYGIPTRLINTPEEARKEVTDLAVKKPDVIKLVYDHKYSRMPTVNRETMEALVKTANELGIKTVIHIGTWRDAEEAVLAGATALTHTNEEEISDELVGLFKQKNIYLIPTLTVHNGLLEISKNKQFLDNLLLAKTTNDDLRQAYLDSSLFRIHSKRRLKRQVLAREAILNNIKKLSDAGVKIMTGTDAGNIGTFQGYSVHTELALLVEAGLSPWQALAAATTVAGEFLGKSFGVQKGDIANLVVLNASPIDDIRNTEKIEMVIHHGKIIDRESLLGTN